MRIITVTILILSLWSCNQDTASEEAKVMDLYELMDSTQIGFQFTNTLDFDRDFNVYKYRNFYNGGGVALGDINNDGLLDIYMVSNQNSNKLFLNKGGWKFEDITEQAGVSGEMAWSTGVTMVDINADGLLDIYVCNSGDVKGDNKENELFINKGNLEFEEAAAAYNINDKGYSTHASFFDYDKDGDLDVYILNNSFKAIGSFNLKKNERPKRDILGGDKLMENRDGKFVDVSKEAGIYGSVIGFGLGVTIGDVNNDNWEDIFVSNDFFERDYLYINQKDGTFSEELVDQMASISGASMGADIADIDNDGNKDIFVTEMLPSEYERLKTVTTFEDWDRYQYNVQNGYHHQFTRNTLHHNNGNNTFSEVSRMAGVEASDWSWGALFFDMNNDGLKDLYIANGIYRDLTNQDYLQYIANESVMSSMIRNDGVNYKELIDIIPSNPVANHAYMNRGRLQFDIYTNSGLLTPSFSNGSAYGDLDNDGDLDLVVNNVNMPSFFYKNKTNEWKEHNYLQIQLKGEGKNTFAIGSSIRVTAGENTYYYENQPTRGFQSSMDTKVTIGVGKAELVDYEITWPDGRKTVKTGVKANQLVHLDQSKAEDIQAIANDERNLLFTKIDAPLDFIHKENDYIDFNKERLVYHMMSTRGPCVSFGDLNKDDKVDLFIPGSKGTKSGVYIQNNSGLYQQKEEDAFDRFKDAEHSKCHLFDADNDGDLDVYLSSGGVELTKYSDLLVDKLMINDGNGNFTDDQGRLPKADLKFSSGAIASADIDNDGDLDLFVGERVKIGAYGQPCSGYVLINDGEGNYQNQTETWTSDLSDIGMITDATFTDLNGDGLQDLVVVGEFMEASIFKNNGQSFTKVRDTGLASGWWNTVVALDADGDGDLDLLVGNHGLNSRFKASKDHPIKMYFNDFDANGFPEGIMTQNREDGNDYPYALRHNLMARLPALKKKYPDFESFKKATMVDIFGQDQLDKTTITSTEELRTSLYINQGGFTFERKPLPKSVQKSPIYAMAPYDFDGDGDLDLLLGGNLHKVQPEVGRYDASYGHFLENDGHGNFSDKSIEKGFEVRGEIRDIEVVENRVFVFRNNDSHVSFEINQ